MTTKRSKRARRGAWRFADPAESLGKHFHCHHCGEVTVRWRAASSFEQMPGTKICIMWTKCLNSRCSAVTPLEWRRQS